VLNLFGVATRCHQAGLAPERDKCWPTNPLRLFTIETSELYGQRAEYGWRSVGAWTISLRVDVDRYRVRPGQAADVDELAELNAAVHLQDMTGGKPHTGIAVWVRDLFEGHHTVGSDDFLVAEDVTTGQVAAGLVGIPQRWTCGPVRMPVVQVELVATDPAHRGNRLTGRLLTALHQRYAHGDPPLYAIAGLPYFYRRFGYEYAISTGAAPLIPAAALRPGPQTTQAIPAAIRPATGADADALAAVDAKVAAGDTLVCPRTAGVWRYELATRGEQNLERREVAVLLDAAGAVTGYLAHRPSVSPRGQLVVVAAACADPAGWPATVPAALAYLTATAERMSQQTGQPFTGLRLDLDPAHPLSRLGPAGAPRRDYAWYVRIDDPLALLRWWQPALTRRWREADLRWPTDSLVIDTYKHRVRLAFRDGELTGIDSEPAAGPPQATLPTAALLQLALGYRTLAEVQHAWPDCTIRDRTTELFLETGFPRLPAMIWPIT
jgi:Acetyltransferase (GNAT) domain